MRCSTVRILPGACCIERPILTVLRCSTFGIPGVEDHTHFLRDVANASAIRSHLIANWNLANLPSEPLHLPLTHITTHSCMLLAF